MRGGLYNLKADFERLTKVDDGVGGFEERWVAFKEGWPCRLQSARSRAHSYLDKTEIDADAVLYCPFFDGLTVRDRVNLKSKGRILSIALVDNWNEANIQLKVYVQETK